MYIDPLILSFFLLATASGFIASMFLPSILEILKPKDKGPRKILKKPLHQAMRQASKLSHQPRSGSTDDTAISKDLEAALKKAGARSQRIGKDIVRIRGDIEFRANSEVFENIVVAGNLVAGEHCVFHSSVKAYGNVSAGSSVIIKGHLLSGMNIDVKEESVIVGSVHADGSIRLGERVYVGISAVAEGDVELFESSEVKKNILAHGSIRVLKHSDFGLPSSMYRID